ncbi:cyclase family protein [Flavobacterium sp. HSC-61S13]|uniref:cyclase family protein n=1 Tax=Flavobacterium sp. HSC-61S13 TaxID=2910963 RepID=UPI0020A005B2|nr:cyclase family protein [Flavobacterium sp. HSC-61S13]MCP1995371.1 kynurenine formamidase [Flavobacterium sp. HSC-61S13]
MKASITFLDKNYNVDFSQPLDISIPLSASEDNPIAWYQNMPEIKPVQDGDWIGKVSEGQSSTNFNNIFFNPHAHGTHTECLGHITFDFYSVNQHLKQFMFLAQLISVSPVVFGEDLVIGLAQIKEQWVDNQQTALVIRTLPNEEVKLHQKYSHANPAYLTEEAVVFLRESGIEHLLIDLPSVDKEKDGGKLVCHKAFWNIKDVVKLNSEARLGATITEMIYVPTSVEDGSYLLNLQIAAFENDASPSKPILYRLE